MFLSTCIVAWICNTPELVATIKIPKALQPEVFSPDSVGYTCTVWQISEGHVSVNVSCPLTSSLSFGEQRLPESIVADICIIAQLGLLKCVHGGFKLNN
jgi:hypothetical protein